MIAGIIEDGVVTTEKVHVGELFDRDELRPVPDPVTFVLPPVYSRTRQRARLPLASWTRVDGVFLFAHGAQTKPEKIKCVDQLRVKTFDAKYPLKFSRRQTSGYNKPWRNVELEVVGIVSTGIRFNKNRIRLRFTCSFHSEVFFQTMSASKKVEQFK